MISAGIGKKSQADCLDRAAELYTRVGRFDKVVEVYRLYCLLLYVLEVALIIAVIIAATRLCFCAAA